MFRLVFRLALSVFGAVLLCDAVLPVRIEALKVDQHISSTGTPAGSRFDTHYTLHFTGGLIDSCSVGLSAYGALHDGDAVSVRSSRLIRFCTRIDREADTLYRFQHWRAWLTFCGLLLIAFAMGWVGSDRDDEPLIRV